MATTSILKCQFSASKFGRTFNKVQRSRTHNGYLWYCYVRFYRCDIDLSNSIEWQNKREWRRILPLLAWHTIVHARNRNQMLHAYNRIQYNQFANDTPNTAQQQWKMSTEKQFDNLDFDWRRWRWCARVCMHSATPSPRISIVDFWLHVYGAIMTTRCTPDLSHGWKNPMQIRKHQGNIRQRPKCFLYGNGKLLIYLASDARVFIIRGSPFLA